MESLILIFGLTFVILITGIFIFGVYRIRQWEKKIDEELSKPNPLPPQPAPQIVDLNPLQKVVEALPHKVLQSIQGSVNAHKGVLGELIGYTQLRAEYDRIIPLGNIVDFVCIRFPKNEIDGCIDFVDVKTGNKKRLTPDQKSLQQLIIDKKINFIKVKVETSADQSTRN